MSKPSCKSIAQDNKALRALLTLPPIQFSEGTTLQVLTTPAPKNETGDRELDAVLWLQDCIRTGEQHLIDQALETAKRIQTPIKELGDRYAQHLMRTHRSSFMAAFGSMGFGDLESQAKSAIEKRQQKNDALSRFGSVESLFAITPGEAACIAALKGVKRDKQSLYFFDEAQAAKRFQKHPDLQPHTLADCIFARSYWSELYQLRAPFDGGDSDRAVQAHKDHCFAMMAKLPPRSKEEALSALNEIETDELEDRSETPAILRNLVSGGWQ